jgi:hypothetical protein
MCAFESAEMAGPTLRRGVLEVRAEEVGVDGVDDVAGDKEGIRVRPAERALDFASVSEFLDDALHDAGEEVAMGALTKQGADFFVVEEGDHPDLGGRRGGVEEGLHGGPTAELVVDTAGEDELSVEATSLCRLSVEELEFPIDDGGICDDVSVCT